MRRNLVPTPIVDKNNKQTTVYKKPAGDDGAATGIPAPAGATSQPKGTPMGGEVPFIHFVFPSLRKKAEQRRADEAETQKAAQQEEEQRKLDDTRSALVAKCRSFRKMDQDDEVLEGHSVETLQKILEVLEAIPESWTINVLTRSAYERVSTILSSPFDDANTHDFNILYANRDALRIGIGFNFMSMMSWQLEPGEFRLPNLEKHWNIDRSFRMGDASPYPMMKPLQQAVNDHPDKTKLLGRFARTAVKRDIYEDRFSYSDAPQQFLAALEEFPDSEEQLLAHYERHGPSSFNREDIAAMLDVPNAISDGWL